MALSQTTRIAQPTVAESIAAKFNALIQEPDGTRSKGLLAQIEELLESLPLPTAEYDLAKARVRNARRYFAAEENGAARYEIRLLRGMLARRP